MAIRNGKRGKFLGCSAFPRCRTLSKLPEEGQYEIITRPEPEPKTAAKPKAAPKAKAGVKAKTTAKAKTATTSRRTKKTEAAEGEV